MLEQGAQVVDVRSIAEFASGRRVIACCASGKRSPMAWLKLRRKGFERVPNAGSWRNLP